MPCSIFRISLLETTIKDLLMHDEHKTLDSNKIMGFNNILS